MPRGNRQDKRGKLKWKSRVANRGRRGGLGSSRHFATWAEVRSQIKLRATAVVIPEEAKKAAKTGAAKPAQTESES